MRLDCAPVRRAATLIAAFAAVLAAALLVAGCGDSNDGKSSGGAPARYGAAASETAAAEKVNFPKVKGRSLAALREGLAGGVVLAPSVSVLDRGENRYGFALFDVARKQIAGVPVALYVSKSDGSDVRGPFPARAESL